MIKRTISILATTVIISASSAFGAVKEGSFSLSPLVGGYVFGDNQQFNATPVVGVRAGYSIARAIGVEALAVVCPPPAETIKAITAPVYREVCEPFLITAAA